jgi:hypothetical protein
VAPAAFESQHDLRLQTFLLGHSAVGLLVLGLRGDLCGSTSQDRRLGSELEPAARAAFRPFPRQAGVQGFMDGERELFQGVERRSGVGLP